MTLFVQNYSWGSKFHKGTWNFRIHILRCHLCFIDGKVGANNGDTSYSNSCI